MPRRFGAVQEYYRAWAQYVACLMLQDACVTWLQEKQELEEQRLLLMEEVQSYRNRIKQLEDDLLFRLSNSQAPPDDMQKFLI